MDEGAWKRELALRARYRESLKSLEYWAMKEPPSSAYEITDDDYQRAARGAWVGWYDPERTYWGYITNTSNPHQGFPWDESNVVFAVGDREQRIDSVTDLQARLEEWASIPKETVEALVKDRMQSELFHEHEEEGWKHNWRMHLEEGPHRMAPGESQLMAEIEDARQFGLDSVDGLVDQLVELRARWGPAIWREHIETCREAGFHDLAKSFQAELEELIPKWENDLKELDAATALEGLMQGLEQWADQVAEEEKHMALTPKEISQQMREADKIRDMKETKSWGEERAEMQDRAGRAVQSACDDIYRRVFEEGWYGRTIFDVVYDRQQPGADKGKDAVDDQQGFTDKQKQEIEDILKTMYGAGQEQNGNTPQQGYSQGMEP